MRVPFLIAILLGTLCTPAAGQTVFSRPYEPNQIALEALVPEFPNDDPSFPTGATFLTATRSLSKQVELAVELPLARYARGNTSTSAVGNPYVGLGLSSTERPFLIELGVRIPAVPTNEAAPVGQRADAGRTAAFRDETVSFSGLLNGRFSLGRYSSLRLRAGVTYTSIKTDTSGTTSHWEVPYSAQIWWDGDPLLTSLSIVGRPSFKDAPDNSTALHRAVLSVMLNGKRVQPGLMLGTGLNPLFTDGEFVLIGGVTLSISYDR